MRLRPSMSRSSALISPALETVITRFFLALDFGFGGLQIGFGARARGGDLSGGVARLRQLSFEFGQMLASRFAIVQARFFARGVLNGGIEKLQIEQGAVHWGLV